MRFRILFGSTLLAGLLAAATPLHASSDRWNIDSEGVSDAPRSKSNNQLEDSCKGGDGEACAERKRREEILHPPK